MQKSRLTDKAIKNTTNAFLGNYKVNSKTVVNGFINLKRGKLEEKRINFIKKIVLSWE